MTGDSEWVYWDLDGRVVRVFPLGLACCAVEVAAALERGRCEGVVGPGGDQATGDAVVLNALVVAGTVTTTMIDEVRAAWDAVPEPRVAVAFGVCTISGGPYWDSYTVSPGLAGVLDADVLVTGCPPGPDSLARALRGAAASV